jgi:LysR family transcriptional regulator, glycine cleavage system transcriptional activator
MSSLKPFEATARHLNFSQAADELFVTQAAVSKQIKLLEEFLGTKLFVRRGRTVSLTDDGDKLYQAVTLGLSHIAETASRIRVRENTSRISIAMRLAFASQFMAAQLSSLQEEFPDIDLNILTTEQNPNSLLDSADMAIVLGHEPQPHLHADLLFSEEVFPVCSPSYLQRHPELTTVNSLADQNLIHLRDTHWRGLSWHPINWNVLAAKLGCTNPIKDSGFSLDNYSLLIQSAISGVGVAIGWLHLVHDQLERNHLVRPLQERYAIDRKHYLVIPRDRLENRSELMVIRKWIIDKTAFLRDSKVSAE